MAHVDWYIEGRSFGNCNCGYACPCQFEEDPTHGNCKGFEVIHIDKGHFDGVDLSGTRAAVLYWWPGPIYKGMGQMQAVIDDRASAEQRDALRRVLHGEETEPEATHWWVFHAMSDTVHDTLYQRIDYEADIEARKASVKIGDMLSASGRPIRPPHGGGEHRVRIDLPNGIEFTLAEIGSGSTSASGAIPLDLRDSYGQWAVIRHGPHGVAA